MLILILMWKGCMKGRKDLEGGILTQAFLSYYYVCPFLFVGDYFSLQSSHNLLSPLSIILFFHDIFLPLTTSTVTHTVTLFLSLSHTHSTLLTLCFSLSLPLNLSLFLSHDHHLSSTAQFRFPEVSPGKKNHKIKNK